MFLSRLKRLILGDPLATTHAEHQKLGLGLGVPTGGGDAISSFGYAPEAIILALGMRLDLLPWVILFVVSLLVVLGVCYARINSIHTKGGGGYAVATAEFGPRAGAFMGSVLMTEYALTIAVSNSSAAKQLVSLAAGTRWDYLLQDWRWTAGIALVLTGLLVVANLRGVKESGKLFAWPTYTFVGATLLMAGVGVAKYLATGVMLPQNAEATNNAVQSATIIILLRACSNGATALTGAETFSNLITCFRPTEWKNANRAMRASFALMALICISLGAFAYVAHASAPPEGVSLFSQMAEYSFGRGAMFYVIQSAVAGILVVASHSALQGSQNLGAIMSRDRWLPRQFANLGDKLSHSATIITMGVVASVLTIFFRGDDQRILPLYGVGVFTVFCLTMLGGAKHENDRIMNGSLDKSIRRSRAIMLVGSLVTGVVGLVIFVSKFTHGAWGTALLVFALFVVVLKFKAHYEYMREHLSPLNVAAEDLVVTKHTVVVLISGITSVAMKALVYAKGLRADRCFALFVDVADGEAAKLRERWSEYGQGVELVTVSSEYRSVLEPVYQKVVELLKEGEGTGHVTVVFPEVVILVWWQKLLHNRMATWLRRKLAALPRVVMVTVPSAVPKEK